jgi:hypothetical protein
MAITMKIAVFWDVNTAKSSTNAKALQRILLPLFSDWGLMLTPHPLLVTLVMKSRAILLPLWVVRPVQSLSACTTVPLNFFLLSEQMKVHSSTSMMMMMEAVGPSEWQHTSTRPHGVTSQKDAVFKYLYFNTKNKNKCIQSCV